MKLNIVPARTGVTWVKLGMRTFFKQPLAMAGLFFMFITVVSVASLIPFLGSVLALGLLPAVTLGLMAATLEASKGKFPMPSILISAFRAGKQQGRAMLILGVLYALAFLLLIAFSALIDGGQMARLYLLGGAITPETVSEPEFQLAMWVSMLLYLPLSMLFWHAPALVHWHGVPPVQSLFYSLVACLRNYRAFLVYGLTWGAVFVVAALLLSTASLLFGSPETAGVLMLPTALLMTAMFFCSLYFTFRDCFEDEAASPMAAGAPTP